VSDRYTEGFFVFNLFWFNSLASAIVLEDVYGLQVQPSGTHDPFIAAATGAVEAMGAAGIYGTYLVDYLPIC
jgi:hypothetical protein